MSYQRRAKVPQDNSALIGQIGTTTSSILSYLGIGVANKRWINLILEGSNNNIAQVLNIAYYNAGATDVIFVLGIPLPYIIGDKNLILTRIKIGVDDTDADDYVDRVILAGWSDYTTWAGPVDLDWDTLYGKDIEENINDHADITIGGVYERALLLVYVVGTTALELDISYVQVEYYYG